MSLRTMRFGSTHCPNTQAKAPALVAVLGSLCRTRRASVAVCAFALTTLLLSVAPAPAGDLNNDGIPDLVFSNLYDGSSYNIDSYVHFGSPGGGFGARIDLPTHGAFDSAIADLNQDGFQDIVFANYYDGNTRVLDSYVYWGAAIDPYTSRTDLATTSANAVEVADLNKDGHAEIIFGNGYSATASYIYWGAATSPYLVRTDLPQQTKRANDVSVGDLNGDGHDDIVMAMYYDDGTTSHSINSIIYWGAASNPYSTTTDLPTHGAYASEIADLNQDGYLDIVFANNYEQSANNANSVIYWGSPAGDFVTSTNLVTSRALDVDVADINSDGFLNIVFANHFDPATNSRAIDSVIYWGAASNPYSTQTPLATVGASGVEVADVNLDGFQDIVFAEQHDGAEYRTESTIYYGDASGTTFDTIATVASLGANGVSIATPDVDLVIDNDGEIDLSARDTPITADLLNNSGLIFGDGRIDATLANLSGGEVRATAGNRVVITGADNTSEGDINLFGGTVEFSQSLAVAEAGRINGRGLLRVDGGLNLQGSLNASGGTLDVFGNATIAGSGRVRVGGGSVTTFFDNVVHNGQEIRVLNDAAVVFFGEVTGGGDFKGNGNVEFFGGYSPGNSPASISFAGNTSFGDTNVLTLELAGTQQGSQYDTLQVAGAASLGGTLEVSLIGPFTPQPGDVFTLMTYATHDGQFDAVDLPELASGAPWRLVYGDEQLTLSVISIAGDVNFDGVVDRRDAALLVANLGSTDAGFADGDFDGDQAVTLADLALLQANLGQSLAASPNAALASVPEPSSGILAALAVLGCLLFQKRGESRR